MRGEEDPSIVLAMQIIKTLGHAHPHMTTNPIDTKRVESQALQDNTQELERTTLKPPIAAFPATLVHLGHPISILTATWILPRVMGSPATLIK